MKQHLLLRILVGAAGGMSVGPGVMLSAQPPARLPTPPQVVARYDDALGGRDAIRRHTSSTAKGTLAFYTTDGVRTVSFVAVSAAPYQHLWRATEAGKSGQILSGFYNDTAWQVDRAGAAQLLVSNDPSSDKRDQYQSVKRDADFYYAIDELSWFKTMETVGIEEYEDQRCYHLHGFTLWGKENNQFYDVSTGLLAGYEYISGDTVIHEIYSGYTRVDGQLVPMKVVYKGRPAKGGEWTLQQVGTQTSITFNDVAPDALRPPPAALDLIRKRVK